MEMFEQIFEQIPKLKGDVWIGGEPMQDPDAVMDDDYELTVWVSDPQDIGTINRFLENKFPELHGHLDYIQGEPSDEEPSVLVGVDQDFSGDEEVSPEDVEKLTSGGGMPPGMEGMIG
jgi:hypothetical protein